MAPTPKVTKFVAKCLESSGATIKIPGAKAVDHAGFVVPDLNEAVGYFVETLGAAVLWWSPPFSVNKDQLKAPPGLNTAPGAAFRLAMLRLGPNLNVELIEYDVPHESRQVPLSSALGVGHLAFLVADVRAAGGYLDRQGVKLLQGPDTTLTTRTRDKTAGFFLTPWGMSIELVQRPGYMPYEEDSVARLFTAS